MPTGPTHKPLPQRAFAYAIAVLALTLVLALAAIDQTRQGQSSGTDITLAPIDTPGSETHLVGTDIDLDQISPALTQQIADLPEDHQFVVMSDASDPDHPSIRWIDWFEGLKVPVIRCDIDHQSPCPFTASSTIVLALYDASGEDIRGLLDVGINVLGYGMPNNPSAPWALAITTDAQAHSALGTRVHQTSYPRARLAWVDAERPKSSDSPDDAVTERDGMLIALLHFLTTPINKGESQGPSPSPSPSQSQSQSQSQSTTPKSAQPLFVDNRID